ncbi:htpn [Mycoplasma tauri]|uniref:htpn n=1 Tax=Mycoplasma tauri TaxID=547987 RepID=UPI001CC0C114|nr:htpn [Mycoplasma tauri]MBZ4203399.1 htpn [Mycoplasma tauri]
MEYKNVIDKFKFTPSVSEIFKKVDINSYNQFLKYGTITTINVLWSNFPKLKNSENNEIDFFKDSSKLLALQKMESILYEYGIAALKEDWTPAQVLDYVEINGELRYLKTKILLNTSKINLTVIEEWSYKNDVLQMEYTLTRPETLTDKQSKEMLFNFFNYKPTKNGYIPYKLFFNNALRVSDLALVNNEYFELINRDLNVLLIDSYLSAPWIFASDSADLQNKIKKGLMDLNNRFISINPQIALYDPEPLRLLQGQSQSDSLIKKIEKNVSWIKKFSNMKQDSQQMGTKNLHTAEVQEINSDFEDHIEAKANLRELQLKEFLNAFYKELEVESVLIYGSTKWLQSEANKYLVNINGSPVNNIPFNQINNMPQIEEEKQEE